MLGLRKFLNDEGKERKASKFLLLPLLLTLVFLVSRITASESSYDFNLDNSTLHTAYSSNAGGSVPPSDFTVYWGGSEIADYNYVNNDNGQYIQEAGGGNNDPYFRFNFTINESVGDIDWINIHINGYCEFGGGEDGDCFVADWVTGGGTWEKMFDLTTSDNDHDYNISSNVGNYIDGDQLVFACGAKNIDTNEELAIDYTQVTVGYTESSDSCSCPGADANWEINLADGCQINADCDLGTGNITFTGSGYANCNSTVNATNVADPGAGNHVYIQENCLMWVG